LLSWSVFCKTSMARPRPQWLFLSLSGTPPFFIFVFSRAGVPQVSCNGSKFERALCPPFSIGACARPRVDLLCFFFHVPGPFRFLTSLLDITSFPHFSRSPAVAFFSETVSDFLMRLLFLDSRIPRLYCHAVCGSRCFLIPPLPSLDPFLVERSGPLCTGLPESILFLNVVSRG